jgi:hypothetical protein
MGPERIELSAKERERLKVLHEVEQGHLKHVEGAPFYNAFLGTCKVVVMSLPMNREIARAKLVATKPSCTWANRFGGNMPPKSARVPG